MSWTSVHPNMYCVTQLLRGCRQAEMSRPQLLNNDSSFSHVGCTVHTLLLRVGTDLFLVSQTGFYGGERPGVAKRHRGCIGGGLVTLVSLRVSHIQFQAEKKKNDIWYKS